MLHSNQTLLPNAKPLTVFLSGLIIMMNNLLIFLCCFFSQGNYLVKLFYFCGYSCSHHFISCMKIGAFVHTVEE